MNALMRINHLRKLAKEAGVSDYRKMKLHELETLNLEAPVSQTPEENEARQAEILDAMRKEFEPKDDDPFDEIDPEVEGDHLDIVEESKTARAERDATREAWLLDATNKLRLLLKQHGAKVPEHIAVSVGFAGNNARKRRGECWTTHASEGGKVNQIFISPLYDDPIRVLATLLHELIHAADNCASQHKGFFSQVARSVGLVGKLTSTDAGEDLTVILKDIASELGPYPHVKLNMGGSAFKKQTTRLLKVQCTVCAMPLRVTAKWIEAYAENTWACPCGDGEIVPA